MIGIEKDPDRPAEDQEVETEIEKDQDQETENQKAPKDQEGRVATFFR